MAFTGVAIGTGSGAFPGLVASFSSATNVPAGTLFQAVINLGAATDITNDFGPAAPLPNTIYQSVGGVAVPTFNLFFF